jgi:cell division protein FtsW (lipid II flippase)
LHDPLGAGYQALQSLFSLAPAGCSAPVSAKGGPITSRASRPTTSTRRSAKSGARSARSRCWRSSSPIVLRALHVARRQPDLYAKLLATGLAAVFGFQIIIIVGGVLRLFPLTGITLPFVSYGGSSLVTNYLLVALVWAISSEPRRTERTVPAARS